MVFLRYALFEDGRVHLVAERTFHFAVDDLEAVRVEQFAEVAFFGRGVLASEESVVETCFGVHGARTFHPVDGGLGLAVPAFCAGLAVQVHIGIDGGDIAVGIFVASGCLNDIGVLQTNLASARAETEEVLRRIFHEVTALDPQFFAKQHLTRTEGLNAVDILGSNGLGAFVVVQHQSNRVEDSADAGSGFLEVLTNGMLEQAEVDHAFHLGVTNLVYEGTDS